MKTAHGPNAENMMDQNGGNTKKDRRCQNHLEKDFNNTKI